MYVRLNLSESFQLDVYNIHLDWRNGGSYCAARGARVEELLECESGRLNQTIELIKASGLDQIKQNEKPKIILGDFNTPSHLDWVDSTREIHFNRTVEWPVTKLLADIGFKDSYRELYPDPVNDPANTWSTTEKTNRLFGREPQDRIDFILYRGNLRPIEKISLKSRQFPIRNLRRKISVRSWAKERLAL
ncbi:unnamed protein product, partial [Mesorhabditis belari]|uniref:Endonuclease/exonuclease/phosphatase domain-containing protein n=1 Tax=Mesorhabditis belari TaxID=2138241 RepID=A0AAF3EJJ1_9BILA